MQLYQCPFQRVKNVNLAVLMKYALGRNMLGEIQLKYATRNRSETEIPKTKRFGIK